ncbi:hypothetical protein DYY67_0889 [Candidatus Nitrosotalea sp. TS]|nr:hypothetical protein [Candidatus Nitrosotalea sp. TS]
MDKITFSLMLSKGDTVPDFALRDKEGKLVKKSDLKGKKYVVYFYPKDFTPGCTQKQPSLHAITRNSRVQELR